jgi:hypothetical protein
VLLAAAMRSPNHEIDCLTGVIILGMGGLWEGKGKKDARSNRKTHGQILPILGMTVKLRLNPVGIGYRRVTNGQ